MVTVTLNSSKLRRTWSHTCPQDNNKNDYQTLILCNLTIESISKTRFFPYIYKTSATTTAKTSRRRNVLSPKRHPRNVPDPPSQIYFEINDVGIICPTWKKCSHHNQSLQEGFRCTGVCLNNSETVPKFNRSQKESSCISKTLYCFQTKHMSLSKILSVTVAKETKKTPKSPKFCQ